MRIESGQSVTLPFFPLPDFVLFPGVYAPLHIFEPRYRAMVAKALDTDGLFCIGTLVGSWSAAEYETASFFPRGCICEVADYQPLPDGRYNLIAHGLQIAEIKEVPSDALYRQVAANPVDTGGGGAVADEELESLCSILLKRLQAVGIDTTDLAPHLRDMDAVALIDTVAFFAPIELNDKLACLAATTYGERHTRLTAVLAG